MFSIRERHLYLCTPWREDLVAFVADVIAGGVDVVQLREKQQDDRTIIAAARECIAVCHDHGIPFILNDRPDLALDVNADGVHVGQDDVPVSVCRNILGDEALVGLSTHSPHDLAGALHESVTYISAGPIEATPTKPGRLGTGEEYVVAANEKSNYPVFVTGGVTPERIAELGARGLRHFVVVRYLCESQTPRYAASQLRAAIDRLVL